jgi:ABC-type antimicrobial peptide transport system permease subunit
MTARAALVGLAGTALGVGGFIVGAAALDPLLYETRPSDVVVIGTTALLLVGLIVAACLVPARAAIAVDPLTILREE